MNTNSLISVIVPVYGTEKFLNRCVKSITQQTYKNLEIILVDDSSPDNCPAMCDEWAAKDDRIKVLHIENKGVANARNKGVSISTGEFIGFVDSDDYIEIDMYECLINDITSGGCDIAVCGFQINSEERGSHSLRVIPAADAQKETVKGDYKFGVLWNKLYRRRVVENVVMQDLVCCEDLVYNYMALKNAKNVAESDYKLYHYIKNNESITNSNFNEGAFDAVRSKEIILSDNELEGWLRPYAIFGYVKSCFAVLSAVITNAKFYERYDELRNGILKYKKEILTSNLYSNRDRIKTIVLWLMPHLYNKFI